MGKEEERLASHHLREQISKAIREQAGVVSGVNGADQPDTVNRGGRPVKAHGSYAAVISSGDERAIGIERNSSDWTAPSRDWHSEGLVRMVFHVLNEVFFDLEVMFSLSNVHRI